ncbi:MAG TPA: copper resistance CopC family protein [Cellulomonas sp.]
MSSVPPPDRCPVPGAAPRSAVSRTAPAPRLLAALVALLLASVVLVAGAARAQAHNVFLGSDPADGAAVATAPERVTLTFDQPAQALGTEILVTDPEGTQVSDGAPELVDSTVSQALAGTLPAGTYTVTWRVTSADGHPISGTLTFTASAEITIGVVNPGPAETTDADPTTEPTDEPTVDPTAGAVIAPAPTSTGTASAAQEDAEDEDAGLTAGAIAAIAVAVLAVGAVAVFVVRERRRPNGRSSDDVPGDAPDPGDRAQS